ncbi:MAG: aspartate ammonia-lyase [Planctomycetes bacterium]|nr:aspartate ammonia-lyase [Planctomycetota bacterium]
MAQPHDPSRSAAATRTEHDALGSVEVPAAALYGAETARAASWAFTGHRLPLPVVHALGRLKAAAAHANGSAGRLPTDVARAIEQAAREVAAGRHDAEFVVDLFQTGSGTSSHMNANEVIANRAAELLGAPRGSGRVRAHDDVNLGQSSNDVIPSAIRLAALDLGERRLLPALLALAGTLHELASRYWHDLRNGRTHLMAAMPIRFGQQFRGMAERVDHAAARLGAALDACRALPFGGTAVGTGVTCPPGLPAAVCAELGRAFGQRVHETAQHLSAQGHLGALADLGADLRTAAAALYKLVDDVRWQASDALRELAIPDLQPGSSIMVGKQNPVVCEAVLMACAQVFGNDAVVAFAESQGRFELNTMLPVVARNVLEAIELLAGAAVAFRTHVLDGLRVRSEAAAAVAANPILATALMADIGHARAVAVARDAVQRGVPVLDAARATGLDEALLRQRLDPERLCGEFGRP